MKIETIFNVGDTVWIMLHNKPTETWIREFWFDNDRYQKQDKLEDYCGWYHENK